jgi:hypothetical protein
MRPRTLVKFDNTIKSAIDWGTELGVSKDSVIRRCLRLGYEAVKLPSGSVLYREREDENDLLDLPPVKSYWET